jgi:myosin heavy subunit
MDIDNLTNLSQLNQNIILDVLKNRYLSDQIYTLCGPILLSVNPYKNINSLIQPNIYNISDKAFNSEGNQTILISGESGAGKTVATNMIIKHLLDQKHGSLQKYILNSTPVLEAFGNAATIRNNNSSRFGKFIQLFYSNEGTVTGCKIKTYLLEKVRVTAHSIKECNFHIFYQLLGNGERDHKFNYCKTEYGDHIPGKEEYINTVNAMKELGFEEADICNIEHILWGILYLGEIEFEEDGDEVVIKDGCEKYIEYCKDYLNIIDLEKLLLEHKIKRGVRETYVIKHSLDQAIKTRDNIAKTIYDSLFNWIVNKINDRICGNVNDDNRFIGILDIFGFEIFDENNFEQLCINYTNEKLQELFNYNIFCAEQELYIREEIPWEDIVFPSNKNKVDTIEKLFSMINEECLVPRGSDTSLLNKINKNLVGDHITIDNKQYVEGQFTVKHYAGNVEYGINSFCDKNKDLVRDDIKDKLIGMEILSFKFNESGIRNKKLISLLTKFKSDLNHLLKTIQTTKSQYIRCIKPNDLSIPDSFNDERIQQQLQYSGTLEAVNISRLGYPVRFTYDEFSLRYIGVQLDIELCKGKTKVFLKMDQYVELEKRREKVRWENAIKIQKNYLMNKFRKIFLLKKRSTVVIQRNTRIYLGKCRIYRENGAKISTFIRSLYLRNKWRDTYYLLKIFVAIVKDRVVKKSFNARVIQTWYRMKSVQKRYDLCLKSIIKIQSVVRMFLKRGVIKDLRKEKIIYII